MNVFEHVGMVTLVCFDGWSSVAVSNLVGARQGEQEPAERIRNSGEIAALVAVTVLLDG